MTDNKSILVMVTSFPGFYHEDWMSSLVTYKLPESVLHVTNEEENKIEAEEENKKKEYNTEEDETKEKMKNSGDDLTKKWQTTRNSLTTDVLMKTK